MLRCGLWRSAANSARVTNITRFFLSLRAFCGTFVPYFKEGAIIAVHLHQGDLPAELIFNGDLAVDTEAMGLNNHRDRLCLLQISDGQGDEHLVQFAQGEFSAPNLKKLLTDPARVKIFHFARFDVAIILQYLGVVTAPVYCTKIASRLTRTFTDRHGFKDLCRDLLGQEVSKYQQTSDWGQPTLTPEQQEYAASDVRHLHRLRDKLDVMLAREGRTELAAECFKFLPTRCKLDLAGWPELDIFAH